MIPRFTAAVLAVLLAVSCSNDTTRKKFRLTLTNPNQYKSVTGDKDVIAPDGSVKITAVVKNTGSRSGSEVVQLYIGDNYSTTARPVKELKGFRKITLKPGARANVEFVIDHDALSFYDEGSHKWVLEKGNFTAYVGSSSGDIRGVVEFAVL